MGNTDFDKKHGEQKQGGAGPGDHKPVPDQGGSQKRADQEGNRPNHSGSRGDGNR